MKKDTEKEFLCRRCSTFLDVEDFDNGGCPNCETDEYIFTNDLEYGQN